MKHKFAQLLFLAIIISITVYAQAVNRQDSLALVNFYNTTNGKAWINNENWLAGPVRSWYGISVASGRVTNIDLRGNNLEGSLPASIGNLTNLLVLWLGSNSLLSGSIPSSLGNLINLTSLDFYGDQLSGSIPVSFGNLVNLTEVYLYGNHLSSSIPSSIGNLKKLEYLDLSSNQLSGGIPTSIGNLAKLGSLDLSQNPLGGTLPPSLGNLVNLRYLQLVDDHLSGTIPASLGNISNLFSLSLPSNQLSGSIPSSLCNLAKLNTLDLTGNQLSGSIPSSLGELESLTHLELGENQLSGSIPISLEKLANLTWLSLNDNELSSDIPSSIGNLLKLQFLILNHNRLEGSIPFSIGNLANLYYLNLDNNHLSGTIPSSIGKLNLVQGVYLASNQLSGGIPSSIGKLGYLFDLDLRHNKLSAIPREIANLPEDISLVLEYNYFTFNGMQIVAQTFVDAFYNHQAFIPVHQKGNTLSVSAGGTLSHNTYKWFRCGKTGTTLVATITGDSVFHPSQNGIYHVTVTNSVATELTLRSDTFHYVALNEFVESIASSENALQQNNKTSLFFVYPNPAKNILHIQTHGKATLSLTNQSGEILFTKTIANKGELNIATLPGGMYFLKNNETGAVQKVIVSK
jgi:Leucine-rich repeat (LRR) protein